MCSQVKRKSFTFTWILENISYSWQKRDELIESPTFMIGELQESKYSLSLYPRGRNYDSSIGLHLNRKDTGSPFLKIDGELALLSKDGSVLASSEFQNKNAYSDSSLFKEIMDVFVLQRSLYIPDDKLTTRCRIWKSDEDMTEDVECFARTRICIERKGFFWNIQNFSRISSEENCSYQMKSVEDNELMMTFNFSLKNPYTDENSICIQLVADGGKIKYLVLHFLPLHDFGLEDKNIRREFLFYEHDKPKLLTLPFSIKDLMMNSSLYLPDDILSFRCECIFSTGEIFHEVEGIIYGFEKFASSEINNHCLDEENVSIASKQIFHESLKSLFHENLLSDIKLKTSTQTFLAHKNILSVRSPVFKAMFLSDMKEKINDCVDIEDLDSDTVSRMLEYVYTAEMKDLQWQNAYELYKAADKYEILSLRDECSTYLKRNLCANNALQVLILADTHQDQDLKISVQDYIFDHDIINSEEWKQMMVTHMELACDTMYQQIQRNLAKTKLYRSAHKLDTKTAGPIMAASHVFDMSPCPSFQFGNSIPAGPFQFASSQDSSSSSTLRKIVKGLRSPRKYAFSFGQEIN